jgi:hypothetical protein
LAGGAYLLFMAATTAGPAPRPSPTGVVMKRD